MVRELKSDIFEARCDVIIHQANCFCTMGSGIARFIREKLPEAYEADCKTKKGDRDKLGHASIAHITKPLAANPDLMFVINLYGQFDYGNDKRYTDYNALADGFARIKTWVKAQNAKNETQINILAVPYRFGCNRAGGDWRVVRAILESVFADDPDLALVICENPAVDPLVNQTSK